MKLGEVARARDQRNAASVRARLNPAEVSGGTRSGLTDEFLPRTAAF